MPSATSHSGSGSKSSGPPPPSGSSGSEVAAGAGAAAPASQHPATGTGAVQTEAMKQILGVIDKKLRNLEKKKLSSEPHAHLDPKKVFCSGFLSPEDQKTDGRETAPIEIHWGVGLG